MRVLVTGAGGFIGYNVCCYFINNGHDVVGWDVNGRIAVWPIDEIDMLDRDSVRIGLEKLVPDLIIHCVGAADVGKSFKNPYIDYSINVTIMHDLLFTLHELQLKQTRVVFLSSAGVYGNPEILPITEEMSVNPLSPYALHKVMCETSCTYFYKNYDMDIKIVRIFSAYGEGLKKQIFWDMHQKVLKTNCLEMFGTGNESRDYINISDLMKAIYLVAIRAPKQELIYNIANGEELTIRYATECFANAVGISKDRISFTGMGKEGNPINWRADISKLKTLGYQKTVDFKEGIEKYILWLGGKE